MWIGACYYDTSRVPSDLFNNDELVGCSGAKSYDRVQDEELLTGELHIQSSDCSYNYLALLCISKEVQSNPAFLKDQPELVELMRDAFIKGHLVPNGKKRVPGIAEIGDLSISADSEAMFGCITGFTKEGSNVKGGKRFLDTNIEANKWLCLSNMFTSFFVGFMLFKIYKYVSGDWKNALNVL